MDEKINSDEARRRFRELLDAAEHRDSHIMVMRYGRGVAVIVPVEWYEEAQRLKGNGDQS